MLKVTCFVMLGLVFTVAAPWALPCSVAQSPCWVPADMNCDDVVNCDDLAATTALENLGYTIRL